MLLPRLRAGLDAYPLRVDGRDLICIRDHEGILDEPVLISRKAFLIASMLDGESSALDIQARYARLTGGELLFTSELERVVRELDGRGLLQNERYAERRRAIEAAFLASPVRPAYHAGRSYPADPAVLGRELDGYLGGVAPDELAGMVPRGAVAPHIDFARGGWCYAWAHEALRRAAPEAVLVLGVAHGGAPTPFVLTTKPFATPFGPVGVDAELAAFLLQRLPELTRGEVAHRAEHSIEFQAVFLRHTLGAAGPPIVPVLCATPDGDGRASPRGGPAVERFVGAVRDYIATTRRRVAVLVSVDFSHVGVRFGDREPPDAALASATSAGDRVVLQAIVEGEAEAFWQAVMLDGNRRRIDAVVPAYVALRILAPCRGRLLRYGQAADPAGGIVSFASLALL